MGYYKWSTGEQGCAQCPEHSVSSQLAAVECVCEHAYYRSDTDDKGMPCTRE